MTPVLLVAGGWLLAVGLILRANYVLSTRREAFEQRLEEFGRERIIAAAAADRVLTAHRVYRRTGRAVYCVPAELLTNPGEWTN